MVLEIFAHFNVTQIQFSIWLCVPLAHRNNKKSSGKQLCKINSPRKVDLTICWPCMFSYAAISINSRRGELIAQIGSNAVTLSLAPTASRN